MKWHEVVVVVVVVVIVVIFAIVEIILDQMALSGIAWPIAWNDKKFKLLILESQRCQSSNNFLPRTKNQRKENMFIPFLYVVLVCVR